MFVLTVLPVVNERQRQTEEHLTHSEDDRRLINSIVLTVFVLTVLPVVNERQRQTKEHLTHSEDDRSLHLEQDNCIVNVYNVMYCLVNSIV